MRADLVSLGVRLGWVAGDEKEEHALSKVRERLRHEGDGLLLVYDNAVDARNLEPYLPPAGSARDLVTSNSPHWRGTADPLEIEVWPTKIGADFLVVRTGRENERAEADLLSEALGGLPLAHEQAAAYCDRTGLSLGNYRKRFEDAPAPLLDAERDAPAQYHNRLTAAKAFAVAIKEAANLNPAADLLITYAALLAPEPIPLFLFSEARVKFGEPLASQLADDGLDEAVAALRAFALVDRETSADERDPLITTETIRLHRLVRTVAAGRLQSEAADEARRVLIEAMATIFPRDVHDDPSVWPRARRLDALAFDLILGPTPPPDAAASDTYHLLCVLGLYRQRALAAYSKARPLLERALAISEKMHGAEHLETAPDLNNLANVLRKLHDFEHARPLLERALAIREKALGPEHPDTATSLINLAALLRDQGDLVGARRLYDRALAIREKALGLKHCLTAYNLNDIALVLHAQLDFDGARQRYERALAILEAEFGPGHPNTSVTRTNFARLALAQGATSEALGLAEAALSAHDMVLGVGHEWTKDSAGATAAALDALGRTGEATAVRAQYGI
jgi:tetratricopeptide (TPR) repeat protein